MCFFQTNRGFWKTSSIPVRVSILSEFGALWAGRGSLVCHTVQSLIVVISEDTQHPYLLHEQWICHWIFYDLGLSRPGIKIRSLSHARRTLFQPGPMTTEIILIYDFEFEYLEGYYNNANFIDLYIQIHTLNICFVVRLAKTRKNVVFLRQRFV